MASLTGALRPYVLPLGALRAVPGSQTGRNQSGARTLLSLGQGGPGLETRAKWNPLPSSAGSRIDQALFYAVDDVNQELLSSNRSSRLFSTKAIAGDAPRPTIERDVVPEEKEGDTPEDPDNPPNWTVKLLYDGDCPLCMKEVNFLRERNKTYRTIKLVDINDDCYCPEENSGVSYAQAMGRIHGILRDGTVLEGVPVFKKVYEEVGLGWVYAVTSIGPVGKAADALYDLWAKYRLPITGRPPLVEVLEQRRQKKAAAEECPDGCKVDYD